MLEQRKPNYGIFSKPNYADFFRPPHTATCMATIDHDRFVALDLRH
jgi:hypothetical protein